MGWGSFKAYGLRGEGLVWMIGSGYGSNCLLMHAMDGRVVCCSIVSSCQSAATSEIVKCLWSWLQAELEQVLDFFDLSVSCWTWNTDRGPWIGWQQKLLDNLSECVLLALLSVGLLIYCSVYYHRIPMYLWAVQELPGDIAIHGIAALLSSVQGFHFHVSENAAASVAVYICPSGCFDLKLFHTVEHLLCCVYLFSWFRNLGTYPKNQWVLSGKPT